ncbi:jg205, partial [Pararge aegeria aegeria]
PTDKECDAWTQGLKYLIVEATDTSFPLQYERWLRKEFYAMENSNEKISIKEVKAFLPRINFKMVAKDLKDLFTEVDLNKEGELSYDEFGLFFHKLTYNKNIRRYEAKYGFLDLLEEESIDTDSAGRWSNVWAHEMAFRWSRLFDQNFSVLQRSFFAMGNRSLTTVRMFYHRLSPSSSSSSHYGALVSSHTEKGLGCSFTTLAQCGLVDSTPPNLGASEENTEASENTSCL